MLPTAKKVTYRINFKRVITRKLIMGVADGEVLVDGEVIYTATDLKVGLFRIPQRSNHADEKAATAFFPNDRVCRHVSRGGISFFSVSSPLSFNRPLSKRLFSPVSGLFLPEAVKATDRLNVARSRYWYQRDSRFLHPVILLPLKIPNMVRKVTTVSVPSEE